MRGFLTRRRALAIMAALVIAFAAFEVDVRLLPPDGVRYETKSNVNGGPITTTSGVITDPATAARWRATLAAR